MSSSCASSECLRGSVRNNNDCIFGFTPLCVIISYRWLHLMDGSPNAGGQPPINSLRPPNIIVSHFLKRRPFDLVSQCTCTLAGPDGSSDLRTIIKTGCCRRWKLSRRPEIILNKSSSYRRPAQIYRSPLNLPRLNQWFQSKKDRANTLARIQV